MARANPQVEILEREVRFWKGRLESIQKDPGDMPVEGCGDNSCLLTHDRGGMHTNGGCRCSERDVRRAMVYWRRLAEFRLTVIRDLRAEPLPPPPASPDESHDEQP